MHVFGFLFYFRALWTIAFSFLLAVAMLSWCAVYQRPFLWQLVQQAKALKAKIIHYIPSTDAALFADIVIHESSLLLMFFTLAARTVLGVLQMLWGFIFKRYD